MITLDRIKGTLLGTAVGDALGMPVEGLSHQNVRMYYKGIKAYRGDEKRGDLHAGQWTDDTQFTFALVRALTKTQDPTALQAEVASEYLALQPDARRWGPTTRAAVQRLADGAVPEAAADPDAEPTNGAPMRAAPLGVWWAATGADRETAWDVIGPVLGITHAHPASLAAGFGQALAVRTALLADPEAFESDAFWTDLLAAVRWVEETLDQGDTRVGDRLAALEAHLDEWPLDLQDRCDGTGIAADESWPFAVAMFARNPRLVEATLLSSINVGGDADTVGAMVGALLGALNGWFAFPGDWHDGLEAAEHLTAEAEALAKTLS